MIIRARAPLRLGLAGGGTDLSPYCDEHTGYVLNATIDRYVYALLEPTGNGTVQFLSHDQEKSFSTKATDYVPLDGILDLHKSVYNRIVKDYNSGKPIPVRLSTVCETPAGSGLGSSSSVVVVMIKAFSEYLNIPLDDYEIAHLAYIVERVDCSLQGGRQDQYAAAFGGFNFMEFFSDNRVVVNPLRVKNWIKNELESSLILYFTGASRESAQIINEQKSGLTSKNEYVVDAMNAIKTEAVKMKECLLKGDFEGIIDALSEGWRRKKETALVVSNQSIDQILEASLNAGARAGKVSGAGGGGFIMIYAPLENRMRILAALTKYPGFASSCHFTEHGTQAWKT